LFTIFYTLASLLIIQGIFSLLEGYQYLAFVRRSLNEIAGSFTPKASILVPCKGIESQLEENLLALFAQDYPAYEIIFVVATTDDSAFPLIERVIALNASANVQAQLMVAGLSNERSEKVNNLLRAVEQVAVDSEVLAFVDSDARVRSDWLRRLVAPLADERIGAVTGFRWYVPEKGGFYSQLLSAWNGSVATTLGDHNNNFAWGGSTAILSKTFNQLDVRSHWQGAVSDDYALTKAVKKNGLRIHFVPRCLTITREDATLTSLLEFTTRQVIITRVYNSKLWWIGMISQIFFNVVFFGGIAFNIMGMILDEGMNILALMLLTIFILGSAKGYIRLIAAREMLPKFKEELNSLWMMYCFGWWNVSILYLYNFIKSETTRRILWRGVLYEMRSPDETLVIESARLRHTL
jgi:cellulose synthase/poly-beta-1,6-N-acetylglucosamine synthase-like glycosyltransferase